MKIDTPPKAWYDKMLPLEDGHDIGAGNPRCPHHPATGTEARVCQDIADRQAKGIAKYGITVERNPLATRQWLQHAYEECLDQAVYLRRAIEEIENGGCPKDCGHSEAEHLAYDEGLAAGRARGLSIDNPYPLNDEDLCEAWAAGHSLGAMEHTPAQP